MTTTTPAGSPLYEQMTWPILVARAKGQWAAIFQDLAPTLLADAVANAPLHVSCPVHGGANGYRLFEHFNDTGRGICNTCGSHRSGFETLAWAKSYAFQDAVREVAKWVRREETLPARPVRPVLPMTPKTDPEVAMRRIKEVWNASTELRGTAAARYFENRGIWPENVPSILRAHPGLTYYDMRTKRTLGTFPCLLAPVKDKDGQLCTLHRTYLTPDGFKADVPEPKKLMPACRSMRGGAIKLFTPGDVLGLAEGMETAMAARAISGIPVWAGVSAVLLEQVEVPASVKHVVIWADLDRSHRGAEAAEALADRLEELGKTVEICTPRGPIPDNAKGVDWLDVLQTQGIPGFPAKWRRWRPTAGNAQA